MVTKHGFKDPVTGKEHYQRNRYDIEPAQMDESGFVAAPHPPLLRKELHPRFRNTIGPIESRELPGRH